jgi:hypothetical protein
MVYQNERMTAVTYDRGNEEAGGGLTRAQAGTQPCSFRLDLGEPDHLGPPLGLLDDVLAEFRW